MATSTKTSPAKKPIAKKPAAPKKPAAKKPVASAKKGPAQSTSGLSDAQRADLGKLDASFAEPIAFPVADIVQEARDLEAILAQMGPNLYAKSDLAPSLGASLASRRGMLEAAETAWSKHRIAVLPETLRAHRTEAESLKREAIAALRYFKRNDSEVQTRLDSIADGAGIADLISDLNHIAALLDEQKGALKKADLPKNPAKRARELAASLGGGSAERAADTQASDAFDLRNRAYWWTRDAIDEIRAAGRYVYRNDPKQRALFKSSATRATRSRSAEPKPSKPDAPADAAAPAKTSEPA